MDIARQRRELDKASMQGCLSCSQVSTGSLPSALRFWMSKSYLFFEHLIQMPPLPESLCWFLQPEVINLSLIPSPFICTSPIVLSAFSTVLQLMSPEFTTMYLKTETIIITAATSGPTNFQCGSVYIIEAQSWHAKMNERINAQIGDLQKLWLIPILRTYLAPPPQSWGT